MLVLVRVGGEHLEGMSWRRVCSVSRGRRRSVCGNTAASLEQLGLRSTLGPGRRTTRHCMVTVRAPGNEIELGARTVRHGAKFPLVLRRDPPNTERFLVRGNRTVPGASIQLITVRRHARPRIYANPCQTKIQQFPFIPRWRNGYAISIRSLSDFIGDYVGSCRRGDPVSNSASEGGK